MANLLRRVAVAFFQHGHELVLGRAVEAVEDFRHHLVAVAALGAGQIRHELAAQGALDIVDDLFLHRFHAQHAVDAFEREGLGKGREHAGGMVRADLGQDHRHRLRVFVLQIIGEDLLVHVGELVPHGPAGWAAQFFHDLGDALAADDLGEHAFGTFRRADQRAGRGNLFGEFHIKPLDDVGTDSAEVGHPLGNLANLLVAHVGEHLGGVLLAEREHEHRGLLDAAQTPVVGANAHCSTFRIHGGFRRAEAVLKLNKFS